MANMKRRRGLIKEANRLIDEMDVLVRRILDHLATRQERMLHEKNP